MSFKNLLKKIIPVSRARAEQNYNNLLRENAELKQMISDLSDALKGNRRELHDTHLDTGKTRREVHSVFENTSKIRAELFSVHEDTKKLRTELLSTKNIFKQIDIVRDEIIQTKRASKESVWGEIFRDTTIQSDWLKSKCFYPGRWAVGYQYLYALYRILNSTRPQHILELGLGQSTTMITQYADSFNNIIHRVTEHDDDWIHYYQKEFKISNNTQIIQLNIEKILYLSQYELFHYENFKEYLGDMKYDLISVDAPFGGTDNEYSRIDILEIIPECLADSFVIMIDDANRKGEQHTIKLLEDKLTEQGILFSTGKYVGDKDTYVIASEDKKFVCTL